MVYRTKASGIGARGIWRDAGGRITTIEQNWIYQVGEVDICTELRCNNNTAKENVVTTNKYITPQYYISAQLYLHHILII